MLTGLTIGRSILSLLLLESFFIKPTWEEVDEEHKGMKMIEIDPGTAFGTGKHDTTQLCIKQLVEYVKDGDKVLDLGCGSGNFVNCGKEVKCFKG